MNSQKTTKRLRALILYKDNGVLKWAPSTEKDFKTVLLGILEIPTVNRDSIFFISANSIMLGALWADPEVHSGREKLDMFNFYDEYPLTDISPIALSEKSQKYLKQQEKEERFNAMAKYGFISPEGNFYRCEYGGHSTLAERICFGQFSTANPEEYLEDHGWCKIYGNYVGGLEIYVGRGYKITDAQLKTLKNLDYDTIPGISTFL